MSDKSGKAVAALLVGAAIGVGIGMLFAPDKGEATREKLKAGFRERRNDLVEKITEILEAKFGMSQADIKSTFDDIAASATEQAGDIVTRLEEKLAELKQAAANLQK